MRVAVIGVGNILFKDEGIGIYAAKYLEENYTFDSDDITIVDGGTLGFKLMSYYMDYDRVFILDTVSIKDTPGSVYNLPADELLGLGDYRQTAHEVEVVEMLEICSMQGSIAEVSLVGIIPEDITSVEIELTPAVKKQFVPFMETVVKAIENTGIQATLRDDPKGLEQIIREYANPSSVQLPG